MIGIRQQLSVKEVYGCCIKYKMALRKMTDLKIVPDPVTSEGVTVGKTRQGDNAIALDTQLRFRNVTKVTKY